MANIRPPPSPLSLYFSSHGVKCEYLFYRSIKYNFFFIVDCFFFFFHLGRLKQPCFCWALTTHGHWTTCIIQSHAYTCIHSVLCLFVGFIPIVNCAHFKSIYYNSVLVLSNAIWPCCLYQALMTPMLIHSM